MNFFYTTTTGLVDLVALAIASAIGLVFGAIPTKFMAAVAVGYFIAQRSVMAVADASYREVVIAFIAVDCMVLCLIASRSTTGRAFAALFFPQIAAFAAFQNGLIGLATMANVQTVFAYLQLLIILGRGASDGYKSGFFGSSRPVDRGGHLVSEKARRGD